MSRKATPRGDQSLLKNRFGSWRFNDPAAKSRCQDRFSMSLPAKDGGDPRLFDGLGFQLCAPLRVLFGIGACCSFHELQCRGGDREYN
jgi:hypothetical protein